MGKAGYPNKSLAEAVWLDEQSSEVEFRKTKPSFLLGYQSAGKTERFPLDMCGNGNFQSRENFSYLIYSSELNKIKSEMWNFPQLENFRSGEPKGESIPASPAPLPGAGPRSCGWGWVARMQPEEPARKLLMGTRR